MNIVIAERLLHQADILEAEDMIVLNSFGNDARLAAARLQECAEALVAIKRKATPHHEDTDEDRRRNLFHVEAKASATLAKLTGETK